MNHPGPITMYEPTPCEMHSVGGFTNTRICSRECRNEYSCKSRAEERQAIEDVRRVTLQEFTAVNVR